MNAVPEITYQAHSSHRGIGNSRGWGGGGGSTRFLKTTKVKEMYEVQLEGSEGWEGVRKKNPFCRRGMDVSWN